MKNKSSVYGIDNNKENLYSRLVSLDGKMLVYREGGSGSISGRTNTHCLKIIGEKVLNLL